jgi:hypothetical protein
MEPRIVQMPPLSVRADLGPKSINDETRTVDLIFTTTTGVRRRDWWTGKEYIEVLSMDPNAVRLDRINGGAPLLDSHSAYSMADILGTVEPGSVILTKKAVLGTVRFSKRDQVDPVWQDVRDGIVRSVSIGYRVYAYDEKPGKNDQAPPTRTATDWEPFEVSMVPIPADAGAKVRGEEPTDANPCEIVTAGPPAEETKTAEPPVPAKEKTMTVENRDAESFHADLSLTPPPKPAPAAEPNERDQGATSERERVAGIRRACLNAKVSRALETKLIESGASLEAAQAEVLDEIGKRDVSGTPAPASRRPEITVGDDPFIHVRAGIEEALLHKAHPYVPANPKTGDPERGFKLTERAREYMGLSLMRTAERYLVRLGIKTERMSEMEMAGLALGLSQRSGMHSTSDFANLLADFAGKTLRAAYVEAPRTFDPITRTTTARDFKLMKRNQLGEAPQLQLVKEHGEIKAGSIGEAKEQYHLDTYAVRFAITRQALINDDLAAFSRLPLMFGRAARAKESEILWAQITGNPDMGDGKDLFHADHFNLDAGGSVISVEAISGGRTAMRTQKGVDGETLLNIVPRFLIVPAALETVADQFVSAALLASQASNVNPFAGRLSVIAEPRLDGDSDIAWYLAASIADGQDVLELAMLEGQDGPLVEQEIGFNIDGIQMKVRHDIGAKVIDWRGLYKNVGDEVT